MLISIVIPVYQAEKILEELIRRIKAAMEFTLGDYTVVLVDDGSTDDS